MMNEEVGWVGWVGLGWFSGWTLQLEEGRKEKCDGLGLVKVKVKGRVESSRFGSVQLSLLIAVVEEEMREDVD
jgi:hypothetical protein